MPGIDLSKKVDVYTRLLINKHKDTLVQFININMEEYLKDLEHKVSEAYTKEIKRDITLFLTKIKERFLIDFSFDHLIDKNHLHLFLAILFPVQQETRSFTYIIAFKDK